MSWWHFINGTFAPMPVFKEISLSTVHSSHQCRLGKGCCPQKVLIRFQEGKIKSKKGDQFHDTFTKENVLGDGWLRSVKRIIRIGTAASWFSTDNTSYTNWQGGISN